MGPESKNVSPDVISRLIGKIVELVMDASSNIDDDQKRQNVQKKAQDLMSSGPFFFFFFFFYLLFFKFYFILFFFSFFLSHSFLLGFDFGNNLRQYNKNPTPANERLLAEGNAVLLEKFEDLLEALRACLSGYSPSANPARNSSFSSPYGGASSAPYGQSSPRDSSVGGGYGGPQRNSSFASPRGASSRGVGEASPRGVGGASPRGVGGASSRGVGGASPRGVGGASPRGNPLPAETKAALGKWPEVANVLINALQGVVDTQGRFDFIHFI